MQRSEGFRLPHIGWLKGYNRNQYINQEIFEESDLQRTLAGDTQEELERQEREDSADRLVWCTNNGSGLYVENDDLGQTRDGVLLLAGIIGGGLSVGHL